MATAMVTSSSNDRGRPRRVALAGFLCAVLAGSRCPFADSATTDRVMGKVLNLSLPANLSLGGGILSGDSTPTSLETTSIPYASMGNTTSTSVAAQNTSIFVNESATVVLNDTITQPPTTPTTAGPSSSSSSSSTNTTPSTSTQLSMATPPPPTTPRRPSMAAQWHVEHAGDLYAGMYALATPQRRYGGSMVAVGDEALVSLYGYNYDHARRRPVWQDDVWAFHPSPPLSRLSVWSRGNVLGSGGGNRTDEQQLLTPAINKGRGVGVGGGSVAVVPASPATNSFYFSDGIERRKFRQGLWRRKATYGIKPPPSYKHMAVSLHELILVFGGDDGGLRSGSSSFVWGSFYSDLYLLSVNSWRWRRIAQVNTPAPRQGGTLTVVGDFVVLFGGLVPDTGDGSGYENGMGPDGDDTLADPYNNDDVGNTNRRRGAAASDMVLQQPPSRVAGGSSKGSKVRGSSSSSSSSTANVQSTMETNAVHILPVEELEGRPSRVSWHTCMGHGGGVVSGYENDGLEGMANEPIRSGSYDTVGGSNSHDGRRKVGAVDKDRLLDGLLDDGKKGNGKEGEGDEATGAITPSTTAAGSGPDGSVNPLLAPPTWPRPRRSHGAVAYEGALYIYGGFSSPPKRRGAGAFGGGGVGRSNDDTRRRMHSHAVLVDIDDNDYDDDEAINDDEEAMPLDDASVKKTIRSLLAAENGGGALRADNGGSPKRAMGDRAASLKKGGGPIRRRGKGASTSGGAAAGLAGGSASSPTSKVSRNLHDLWRLTITPVNSLLSSDYECKWERLWPRPYGSMDGVGGGGSEEPDAPIGRGGMAMSVLAVNVTKEEEGAVDVTSTASTTATSIRAPTTTLEGTATTTMSGAPSTTAVKDGTDAETSSSAETVSSTIAAPTAPPTTPPISTTGKIIVTNGANCAYGCRCLSDTWAFDLATYQWSNLHTRDQQTPVGRYFTSYATLKNRLFMFGGESYSPYAYWNDMWSMEVGGVTGGGRGGSVDDVDGNSTKVRGAEAREHHHRHTQRKSSTADSDFVEVFKALPPPQMRKRGRNGALSNASSSSATAGINKAPTRQPRVHTFASARNVSNLMVRTRDSEEIRPADALGLLGGWYRRLSGGGASASMNADVASGGKKKPSAAKKKRETGDVDDTDDTISAEDAVLRFDDLTDDEKQQLLAGDTDPLMPWSYFGGHEAVEVPHTVLTFFLLMPVLLGVTATAGFCVYTRRRMKIWRKNNK